MNRLKDNLLKISGDSNIGKVVKLELNGSITFDGRLLRREVYNGKVYINIGYGGIYGSTICLDEGYLTKCEVNGIMDSMTSNSGYFPIISDTFNDISPIVFDLFKEVGGISRCCTDYISLAKTKYISLERYLKTSLHTSIYDVKRAITSGFTMIYSTNRVIINPKILNDSMDKALRLSSDIPTISKEQMDTKSDETLGNTIVAGNIIPSFRNYSLYVLLKRIKKKQC